MLMEIHVKLERIVELLEGEFGDEGPGADT